MGIRLWPRNFEAKDFITKEEKKLLRLAEKNFKDGHFAIGINPMGQNKTGNPMGLYISPNEGLLTFTIMPDDVKAENYELYFLLINTYEDIIYKRLLDSQCLIARNGDGKILKFPYKHIIVFPSANGVTSLDKTILKELKHRVTRGFFSPIDSKRNEKHLSELMLFEGIRKSYDKNFQSISELEAKGIFERLAPEYTIILNEKDNQLVVPNTTSIPEKDMLITGKEMEYKTFFLDDYQVNLVNEMGKGHRVILANPGAGKSVLLLSKAFKYSNLYKESNILLTCYNNNLADFYNFKYDCAGYVKKNLYIMTFHKLVKKLYEECLHISIKEITDEQIRNCINYIKRGIINISFKAIFIDEVQIFDSIYLELCYLLLDKRDDNYTFLMMGDLNQRIRSSSKKGDAPWKKINEIKLDFTGRVKYIEKNYRNSKDISEYLYKMLEHMNSRLSMLNIIKPMEYEYNTFTFGEKNTIALKVKTGIKRIDIQKETIDSIKEIIQKYDLSYNEIAVLFPYKQHNLDKYYFLNWMKDSLDKAGIPYSVIIRSDESPVKYRNTNGVVFSTIESSLGLDFKAVIISGLHPYSFIVDDTSGKPKTICIKKWEDIQKMSTENKESVQNQMRSIYTACSRARDILYVLSDLKKDTPMEEIIKKR